MAEKVIKAVCGFSNESSAVKEELKQAAKQRGIELICISRYRKEGIRQYITENPDCNTVILQETLQISSPYTADDLTLLADERNINIIIALNRRHYGNKFMKTLYVAGITNALYEEDAYAKNIIELVISGRSRKESRQYYGIQSIQDLEKEFEIIEEDQLNNYIDYITTGGPANEIKKRYEFIAKSLKKIENNYMMGHLSEDVKKLLIGSLVFEANLVSGKKKKSLFSWRKKDAKLEHKPVQNEAEKIKDTAADNGIEESSLHNEEVNKQLYEEVDNHEKERETENSSYQSGNNNNQDLIFEDISDLFSDEQSSINREETEDEEHIDNGQNRISEPEIGLVDHSEEVIQESEGESNKEANRQTYNSKRINGMKIYAAVGAMVFLSFIVIGFLLISGRKVNSTKNAGHIQVREGDGSAYETEPINDEIETDNIIESETPNQTEPEESETILESETPEETEAETEEDVVEAQAQVSDNPPVSNANNEIVSFDTAADVPANNNQPSTSQQHKNAGSENNTTTYVVNNKTQSQDNSNTSTNNDSSNEPDSPQTPDYQGRIYSGSEVIRIAQNESNNGVSIFIRSRESGEGFFSGTEVSSIIDTSCSYLAMSEKSGSKLVQLSFIQQ